MNAQVRQASETGPPTLLSSPSWFTSTLFAKSSNVQSTSRTRVRHMSVGTRPLECEHAWPLRLLAPRLPDHAWRNQSRPRHPAGARAERSDQARDVTARSLSKQFPRCLGSRQSVALQPLPPTPTYTLFFFFLSVPSTPPTELPSFRAVALWRSDCVFGQRMPPPVVVVRGAGVTTAHVLSPCCRCLVTTPTRAACCRGKGESNLIKGLSKLIVR